jgi:lipoprotein NlpD
MSLLTRFLPLAALALLAACASPTHRAPVEDRRPVAARPVAPATGTPSAAAASAAEPAKPPPPGIENAGKPGYYTVQKGDTLIRIGLDTGQPWKDIARWNAIDNPNLIEVGQVMRVVPPGADANGVTVRPVAQAGRVDSRPLDPTKPVAAPAAAASAASGVTTATAPPAPATAAAREADDDLSWSWPAAGPVVTPFDDSKSKGLGIGGQPGDPVFAAADGRVVYAGSGLRGYGNLVIVKHNGTYLTAYAHNQSLLVKEEQIVRRGQKIAEMGSSDAESVQLHFEIRRLGKPVDPARLLPPR